MRPTRAFFVAALFASGCLEYSPYDGSVCRTGVYERLSFEDGEVRRETAVSAFDDDPTHLEQCAEIGNVSVRGSDGNLDFLANVEAMGALVIGPTTRLQTLSGLESLARVDGDLVMFDNEGLASLEALGALRRVGGGLVIEDAPSLSLCAAATLLGQLDAQPSTVELSGLEACEEGEQLGTGRADTVLRFDGMSQVLEVAQSAQTLLLTGTFRGTELGVSDENGPLSSTSTSSQLAEGVTVAASNEGEVHWALFSAGDWPLSYQSERSLAFDLPADGSATTLFAGWVSSQAQLGDQVIDRGPEPEALWVGRVDPSGGIEAPSRIGQLDLVDVTEILDIAAIDDSHLWVLLRIGDGSYTRFELAYVDLEQPDRSTSSEVASGVLEFGSLRVLPRARVALTGSASGSGTPRVGITSAEPSGGFGFWMEVSAGYSGGQAYLEFESTGFSAYEAANGSNRAPDCIAARATSGYASIGVSLGSDQRRAVLETTNGSTRAPDQNQLLAVDGALPMGLGIDRQLACAVVDGRLVVSGLDSFARGGGGDSAGWRLSTLEPGTFRPRLRSLSLGEINIESLASIESAVSETGQVVLYGPMPRRLTLGETALSGTANTVFVAVRQLTRWHQ